MAQKKWFFKTTIERIAWQDAKFSCAFDNDLGLDIFVNGKKLINVFEPNSALAGVDLENLDDAKAFCDATQNKLNAVFAKMPERLLQAKADLAV